MDSYTLKQIQQRFDVPQHVLIHLCEKGVIEPEIADPQGRGKVREFSEKNLFEFAVALELKKYQMPIVVIRSIIKLLSSFERSAQKTKSNFKLPSSITSPNPELLLYIYEGETVIFGVGKGLIFSFELSKVLNSKSEYLKAEKVTHLPKEFQSQLTINLSNIAESILDK